MDAVEDGLTDAPDFRFSERGRRLFDFLKHLEQIHLRFAFLTLRLRDLAFVLAEEVTGTFGNGQQSSLFAGDFDEAAQVLEVCPESLRDLARRVVFENKAGGLGLLGDVSSTS